MLARSGLTEYIIKYLSTEYNIPIENISEDSSFRVDLGLDSLALMDLVCVASDALELDLCADDINSCNTIKEFINVCMDREIEWRR